jgi:hypothetical protein
MLITETKQQTVGTDRCLSSSLAQGEVWGVRICPVLDAYRDVPYTDLLWQRLLSSELLVNPSC